MERARTTGGVPFRAVVSSKRLPLSRKGHQPHNPSRRIASPMTGDRLRRSTRKCLQRRNANFETRSVRAISASVGKVRISARNIRVNSNEMYFFWSQNTSRPSKPTLPNVIVSSTLFEVNSVLPNQKTMPSSRKSKLSRSRFCKPTRRLCSHLLPLFLRFLPPPRSQHAIQLPLPRLHPLCSLPTPTRIFRPAHGSPALDPASGVEDQILSAPWEGSRLFIPLSFQNCPSPLWLGKVSSRLLQNPRSRRT